MRANVILRHDRLWLWCPGCDDVHAIVVTGEGSWNWNADRVAPSIDPSIKVEYVMKAERSVCHSFVRDGAWQFLSDSTHKLAGQIVRMSNVTPNWPEWLAA
jgi:hypothetical protein